MAETTKTTNTTYEWTNRRLLFSPERDTDIDWMDAFAQAPSVLERDTYLRIYFSCRPKPIDGRYVSYSAYVDVDKRDFSILRVSEQPALALGERGTFDEFGIYPFSAIDVGDEVHAYYGGWTRCTSVPFNVTIGKAVSRDGGKTFERIGPGPVLSYTLDEPFVLSGPKIRRFGDTWYLFYIAGREWLMHEGKPEPVYKIRLATSADGVNWVKQERDLIESIIPDEAQASPDVFYENGSYHMFFCYRDATDYRKNPERTYRLGYASSQDLLNWTRDDDVMRFTRSDVGFDDEMVAYPHTFVVGGKRYLLYLGNEVGRAGFGIAERKEETT
ncbi:glycosylase [Exiguobacterium sp. SH3S1]|uniref:glycosylase n=1 Tax=Exiguobacterium sp. SH3S1 TaxID=2510955 RepID=UPI00103FA663|nr:glycosylase [Exiguobacterium sp. SH3S1]TCI64051.1 glycosylase [Exiguobacterium sp. SH3S1]